MQQQPFGLGKVRWLGQKHAAKIVLLPKELPAAAIGVRAIEKIRRPVIRQPTGGTLPIATRDNKQHSHDANTRPRYPWDGVVTLGAVLPAEY